MRWLTRIDRTGYGQHGDYMFGWEGDSLQQAMDARCNVACPQLQSQSDDAAMNCKIAAEVDEPVDGCRFSNMIYVLDNG